MTRSIPSDLIPSLQDLESTFLKNKDMTISESGTKSESGRFTSFDQTPNKKESEYEPGKECESKVGPNNNTMAYITTTTMEEYQKRMCQSRPGLVYPIIPNTINFELKRCIFSMLKDIPFYAKDHEDTYKHIDEVNDIAAYYNFLDVP